MSLLKMLRNFETGLGRKHIVGHIWTIQGGLKKRKPTFCLRRILAIFVSTFAANLRCFLLDVIHFSVYIFGQCRYYLWWRNHGKRCNNESAMLIWTHLLKDDLVHGYGLTDCHQHKTSTLLTGGEAGLQMRLTLQLWNIRIGKYTFLEWKRGIRKPFIIYWNFT